MVVCKSMLGSIYITDELMGNETAEMVVAFCCGRMTTQRSLMVSHILLFGIIREGTAER